MLVRLPYYIIVVCNVHYRIMSGSQLAGHLPRRPLILIILEHYTTNPGHKYFLLDWRIFEWYCVNYEAKLVTIRLNEGSS